MEGADANESICGCICFRLVVVTSEAFAQLTKPNLGDVGVTSDSTQDRPDDTHRFGSHDASHGFGVGARRPDPGYELASVVSWTFYLESL